MNFLTTEAGQAALVTMPDLDTGARGTGTVYCVSMNVDANHDGTMDTSFNGPDATSQASPDVVWVNNGYIQPGSGGGLDKDLPVAPTTTNYNFGQITCPRDLENFFRLWICGVPAMTYSNNLSATLTCSAITGSPAINIFAAETNGGILYLTDTNTAQSLVNQTKLGTVGATTSGSGTLVFPNSFFDGSTKHLLFEGAGIGEGQFTLTIYQGTNAICQSSVYLDLHDVKDFYERVVITNNTSSAKSGWTSGIEIVQPASASGLGADTNLIVMVHGINVGNWHWLNASETVFKRLYWAGYQGKFSTVKWPCNLLTPIPSPLSPANFNDSELQGYKSSTAFTAYMNNLRFRFPNYRRNIIAHSQGNTVVSEALKYGLSFDTYILTQGALPDSAYDINATNDPDLLGRAPTPESQPMGYLGVYTNLTGNIVNFYNPQDPVLDIWVKDQEVLKPSIYFDTSNYTFDGTNSYYDPFIGFNYLVTDPEESRAEVSRSRTLPIGQSEPETPHGVIRSAIDLHARFNFGNTSFDDHSAQWVWPIQTTIGYYQQVREAIKP